VTDSVGYSGKPLAQKLGIKAGDTILVVDAPEHYADVLAPLPADVTISGDAMEPSIVHAFIKTRAALDACAAHLVTLPRVGGALWISWAKKASPQFVDLTENGIREAVLPPGWVDVKVCAVDQNWSGLKFLRRRT